MMDVRCNKRSRWSLQVNYHRQIFDSFCYRYKTGPTRRIRNFWDGKSVAVFARDNDEILSVNKVKCWTSNVEDRTQRDREQRILFTDKRHARVWWEKRENLKVCVRENVWERERVRVCRRTGLIWVTSRVNFLANQTSCRYWTFEEMRRCLKSESIF